MQVHDQRGIDLSGKGRPSLDPAAQFRAVVFGSKLNVLVLLLPVAVSAHVGEFRPAVVFAVSLLTLAPLAERLGYATEQVSLYTNSTLGGKLTGCCALGLAGMTTQKCYSICY
jgi:hypothetical protein